MGRLIHRKCNMTASDTELVGRSGSYGIYYRRADFPVSTLVLNDVIEKREALQVATEDVLCEAYSRTLQMNTIPMTLSAICYCRSLWMFNQSRFFLSFCRWS
jgi:hypothetical protein